MSRIAGNRYNLSAILKPLKLYSQWLCDQVIEFWTWTRPIRYDAIRQGTVC